MAKRIKYLKQDNILTTKDKYTVNGVQYTASINTLDNTYSLVLSDGTLVETKQAKTLHRAKMEIKKELQTLGVVFRREKRKRVKVVYVEVPVQVAAPELSPAPTELVTENATPVEEPIVETPVEQNNG